MAGRLVEPDVPLCRKTSLRTVTTALTLALAVAAALLPAAPARAEPSASDLAGQLSRANQQLDIVVERYDQEAVRLADLTRRSAALQVQLAPLQTRVSQLTSQLGAVSTGLYEQSAAANLSTLLGAASPEAALDTLATVDYFASQRGQLLRGYQAARRELDGQQDTLDVLTAQSHNQQATLAAQKAAIQARIADLRQLRGKLYGSGSPSPARTDPYLPAYQAGPAGVAIRYAFAQIGRDYQFGAAGPDTYDCSGLTMASWGHAGVSLPHSAAEQWRVVSHLSRSQLQPGDLVFYYSDIHHVAIYIGGGRVVHAPTWGEQVRTAPMDLGSIYGYGRVKL